MDGHLLLLKKITLRIHSSKKAAHLKEGGEKTAWSNCLFPLSVKRISGKFPFRFDIVAEERTVNYPVNERL